MPGFLLHEGALVLCEHGGLAQPLVPYPRVTVSGQPIVLQPLPYVIAGCPFVMVLVPMPCVTGIWVMGATRVMANGMPVLLQDSQAICTPNGTPLNVIMTQVRVKGM
jgi:hypothetical protein